MATDKKSVLLYCDIITTVEKLSNENAGLLLKHYLRYINDLNPDPPNDIVDLVFEPIKQNLKRDLKSWEAKCLKNSDNAKIRWDKENASECERIKPNAKNADKDTVTDIVKEKVIVKDINIRKEEFKASVKVFLSETFPKDLLQSFFNYWTEINEGGKKMRFEMQKVFEIKKRLTTWKSNEIKFSKNGKGKTNSATSVIGHKDYSSGL